MSLSRFGDWLASTMIRPTAPIIPSEFIDDSLRRFLVLSKLFTKSWGHPKTLQQLAKHRKEVMSRGLVCEMNESVKTKIAMHIDEERVKEGMRIVYGHFRSPHAVVFPEQMPGLNGTSFWKGFFPTGKRQGLCIHLAGTGDHSYYRRELGFVHKLMKNGVASILIQNPFYAQRKPSSQLRSSLENVSDLFVMGGALMSEVAVLLKWSTEEGYGPLAVSGVSMGGFMASLAASNATTPIGVVPILSWTTAAPPYTEGSIAPSIPYKILEKQLLDRSYIEKLNSIPDVHWVDKMHESNKRNQKGLAYNMMCVLMNEFTLQSNYPTPPDTSLCTAIVAECDRYVVRTHGAPHFSEVWPGMRVTVMPGVGHVEAYVLGHDLFCDEILRVLRKAAQ